LADTTCTLETAFAGLIGAGSDQDHEQGELIVYRPLTASDLWPGKGWDFVFGQANLRKRVGVWSIYRNGDPAAGEAAYRLCLRRTLATATHETGHILTMKHCTAYACLMNGSNHQAERDSRGQDQGLPLPRPVGAGRPG
jgi:predicted Zn-dependent protease